MDRDSPFAAWADALKGAAQPDVESTPTPSRVERERELVEHSTRIYGQRWAERFARTGDLGAEMVLRNPAVYTDRDTIAKLPPEMEAAWARLQHQTVDTLRAMNWDAWQQETRFGDPNPLALLQQRVAANAVPTHFRGIVGRLIRDSTELFAQSVRHVPGDTRYFAGNAAAARIQPPVERAGRTGLG
jgi:hypothetical protein